MIKLLSGWFFLKRANVTKGSLGTCACALIVVPSILHRVELIYTLYSGFKEVLRGLIVVVLFCWFPIHDVIV